MPLVRICSRNFIESPTEDRGPWASKHLTMLFNRRGNDKSGDAKLLKLPKA